MAELKPCPCGGEAYLYSDGWRVLWGVKCSKCSCDTASQRTPSQAIEAWNRMAGDNS